MRLRNIIACALAATVALSAAAERLVILHTNDTHSNIESDRNGVGGILPRKAIIDSVRKAEKNVILVDAGDMVQGTLYFKYFRGDVEYPLFNMMGYDVRILGNHEFDNGIDELARNWKKVKGARLSANYDFSKIGFNVIGIFDVNPRLEGLAVRGIEIQMIDTLEDFLRTNKVDVAALTVPKKNARAVATRLEDLGIKAIWNFAPIDLKVSDDVLVQNVHLAESLMNLSFNYRNRRKDKPSD